MNKIKSSALFEEAKKYIEKAVSLRPDDGFIRDSLGWVYYKKGMYDDALVEIKKASEIEKEDPLIFEHLGDVYIKLNKKEAREQHGTPKEIEKTPAFKSVMEGIV